MLEISRADKVRRTQFLGREFLTWLMYRSARDEGVLPIPGEAAIQVFFERALTLDGDNPAREMATIKVDDPTDSEEVMVSLRLGKKVSRARLIVQDQGQEYTLVLDGTSLSMRNMKLPETAAMDPIENMAEKAGLCARIEDLVHSLFVSFMRIRLDEKAWNEEADGLRSWLGAA
jgi:recombination associated protein RdgC